MKKPDEIRVKLIQIGVFCHLYLRFLSFLCKKATALKINKKEQQTKKLDFPRTKESTFSSWQANCASVVSFPSQVNAVMAPRVPLHTRLGNAGSSIFQAHAATVMIADMLTRSLQHKQLRLGPPTVLPILVHSDLADSSLFTDLAETATPVNTPTM